MGGRRLPCEKVAVALGALVAVGLAMACNGATRGTATVTTATGGAAPPTETATPAPQATPTRDVLAAPPKDADDARAGLESEILASPVDPCPARLRSLWNVRCATGDLDSDGKADTAYLVPLQQPARTGAVPGAVFLLRTGNQSLAELRLESDADASRMGQDFFAVADRTGAGGPPQVSVLSAACTTTGCTYGIHLEAWDGTAWRDIGPTDTADFLDHVEFRQSGTQWQLLAHAGAVRAAGAGPTRPRTMIYAFDGRRFGQQTEEPDKPVYLFHAIEDADAKFEAARLNSGDWQGAIDAYRLTVGNKDLKDWQQEARGVDGRAGLESYALFRIAVATAASGANPTAAIDAVVKEAKDPLFAYAAEQFRQGFLDRMSVHAGCLAATRYLATITPDADNPAHIHDVFDYGYANLPVRKYTDICPL